MKLDKELAKKLMVEEASNLINELEDLGIDYNKTSDTGRIDVEQNGFKCEYHMSEGFFVMGWESNHSAEDLETVREYVVDAFGSDHVYGRTKIIVRNHTSPSDFFKFLKAVEDSNIILDPDVSFTLKKRSRNTTSGVVFENSNFSNAHERATTIGPRFMNMVCKASGMDLFKMDAEWGTDDAGRIDGVEMDETEKFPISIYECQSGIQNGAYLDDEHLNKSLLRYPSDPEIAPTLKKIVILAGGYTKEHLITIKWQSELLKVKNIEVILLKTNRIEDKIGVEIVNY